MKLNKLTFPTNYDNRGWIERMIDAQIDRAEEALYLQESTGMQVYMDKENN